MTTTYSWVIYIGIPDTFVPARTTIHHIFDLVNFNWINVSKSTQGLSCRHVSKNYQSFSLLCRGLPRDFLVVMCTEIILYPTSKQISLKFHTIISNLSKYVCNQRTQQQSPVAAAAWKDLQQKSKDSFCQKTLSVNRQPTCMQGNGAWIRGMGHGSEERNVD